MFQVCLETFLNDLCYYVNKNLSVKSLSSTWISSVFITICWLEIVQFVANLAMITEGLPGVLGNKETLAKYRREQGNMSLILGNRGTKLYKLEDENIASKLIKRGTNKENVWEHWNIR